jgi:hypothetical protein
LALWFWKYIRRVVRLFVRCCHRSSISNHSVSLLQVVWCLSRV